MAPRAFGALFALVAAMLLLASLGAGVAPKVIPGWWDGHPRVDGKTIERKEIHVGLLGGHGCNLGGTVNCEPLPTGTMLAPIGIAELAAIGVTLATLVALMMSAWTIGDRRKWLAKVVLGETVLIALIGAVLVFLGPQIKSTQHVDVPIGIGMMMFWAGVGSASIAGVLTRRLEREPLRLRASKPAVKPEPKPEPEPDPVPAFDFNELLREDQQRAPVPSPGGHLAGPAGPLMPMGIAPPPLSPLQMLPPLAPSSPPPMPHFELPPRVPTEVEMGLSPPVPPPRSSSPSVPPALGPTRTKAASLPPPPSKFPTLEHAIPPPPTVANQLPPTVLPAQDGAVNVQRDPADPITAVEVDADAKARGAAASTIALPGMPPIAPLPSEPRAATDIDVSTGDSMAPSAARDSAETLARERVSASVIAPPPRDSAETLARPRVSAPTIDPEGRAKPDLLHLGAPRAKAPTVNPPLPALDPARPRVPAPAPRDSAATIARPRVSAPVIETTTAEPEPPVRASQVPISTAPASLPPPRKTTQAVAGPTPGCPQCEAPMAWVEEHLRFYCPQCRMYF